MEQKITEIISEICSLEPGDFTPDLDLFEAGFLDSFGTLQMLVQLGEAFGVNLDPGDIAREEVASVEQIIATISKKKGAS